MLFAYVPSHIFPSPMNPGRHEQVKLPGVFIHSALGEQSFSISNKHSSISRKHGIAKKQYTILMQNRRYLDNDVNNY